jgi:hypothetical protein
LAKLSWPRFNDGFKQTIKRLKNLSRFVDAQAVEVRLRNDDERNTEVLSAIELLKITDIIEKVLPCYYVPFGIDETVLWKARHLGKD